jgi:hypothetical protein
MPFNLPKKFTGRYINLLGEIRYYRNGSECKEEEVEALAEPVKKTQVAAVVEAKPDIPEREQWLHENPEAKAALEAGLTSATQSPLVDLGSFAEHVDEVAPAEKE